MTLTTDGPIKIAYDEPRTNSREGMGATAAIIATLGEAAPDNAEPCNIHFLGDRVDMAQLIGAILASAAKDYGEHFVQVAITYGQKVYGTPEAFQARLSVEADNPKGRTNG